MSCYQELVLPTSSPQQCCCGCCAVAVTDVDDATAPHCTAPATPFPAHLYHATIPSLRLFQFLLITANGNMRHLVLLCVSVIFSIVSSEDIISQTDQKCDATEFSSIREQYEGCANDKILTITAKIQSQLLQTEHENIICNTVRQLISVCGDILLKCFTLEQVDICCMYLCIIKVFRLILQSIILK